MTAFEFVDELPEAVRTPRKFTPRGCEPLIIEFADALRENPKQWAKYPKALSLSTAKSYVSAIKTKPSRNGPKPLQGGAFEATTRKGVLYVRYVGGES